MGPTRVEGAGGGIGTPSYLVPSLVCLIYKPRKNLRSLIIDDTSPTYL